MKTFSTLAILCVMVPASVASMATAQQTGRVPTPARPSPVVATPSPPATTPAAAANPTTAPAATPEVSSAPPVLIVPPVVQAAPPSRPGAARPTQTSLLLELETSRNDGRIAVAIYRDSASFRRSRDPVRTLMLSRDGPVTRAWVLGLPPGRYAISAFQDVDGDGKLGTNNFRIPREPFGFSRDARGRFGAPAFDDAAFELTPTGTTQRVILRNPISAILR